ncbi:MAG TPA: ABC transporter ATP-binding protein [Steroidobacteraceae bacterium]|nr:ABC transporter ATP-binding protein [Steroidobacteraceae bacterium]
MSLLSELWSILTPAQRRRMLAAQLVVLAMAFSTVTGIAAIAPFFAVLGEPQLIDHNAVIHWLYLHLGLSSKRDFIVLLGSGFIAVVLVANLINAVGTLIMAHLAMWIGNQLQTVLFNDYLSRPYSFHAATNSALLVKNIVYESVRVTHGILLNTLTLVASLVTAGFIIIACVLLNPTVTLATIAVLAAGYGLIYLSVRNRVLRCGQALSHLSTDQARVVNEGFGAIKELTLRRARSYFSGRFERLSKELAAAAAHNQLIAQSPRYLMECVAAAGLVGIALVLLGRSDGIGPWLGQLTFLAFAAYRLLPTLQQIFALIVKIRADRPALALIAPDLRHAQTLRQASATAVPRPSLLDLQRRPRHEIRLEEVSFRYTGADSWALRGVSLCIPAQRSVGIVGANGSGKSTLADLIAGLLVPSIGRILIDGAPLEDEQRAGWQAQVAYVPQSTFMLDATIAENIALGTELADIDPARVREAARQAQLEELLGALPEGLLHKVGERGVRLSGGQRQRIGIARALYRQASVLLLDEATNALDGLTEKELMMTLRQLRGHYTSVLIAHRMSTVRACDLIIQLEHGRVIASGTYEELLRNSEAFRQMAGLR